MTTARILIATDLSDAADEALRQAHARAAATGAKLGVVHVMPNLLGINPLFPQLNAPQLERLAEFEATARGALEENVARVLGPPKPEVFIDHGVEHVEIVRRAEAWKADLVVVGSHGRTGLPRLMLGSVAEHVVRLAHCPVLIARKSAAKGVVLAATDLSDPSLPAIATGAEEAKRRGARLLVVHAMDFVTPALTASLATPFVAGPPMLSAEAQKEAREGLMLVLKDAVARFNVQADLRVLDGPAAAAIVRCAEEVGAELLVVGTHGRTGIARIALGSTAERVIRAVACSVLAVRLK